jgi:hypothetical protein
MEGMKVLEDDHQYPFKIAQNNLKQIRRKYQQYFIDGGYSAGFSINRLNGN